MKQLFFISLMTCILQLSHADPFRRGYYYDHAAHKIEGWLRYNQAEFGLLFSTPGYLDFKEKADSKKIRLGPEDISSFVIGRDSFAIVYNIKVNGISGYFEKDFAEVRISGAIRMFVHNCLLWNGKYFFPHQSYIISKDDKYFFAVWRAKKQKEKIAEFFSDDKQLEELILDKHYYDRIPELVGLYNKDNS